MWLRKQLPVFTPQDWNLRLGIISSCDLRGHLHQRYLKIETPFEMKYSHVSVIVEIYLLGTKTIKQFQKLKVYFAFKVIVTNSAIKRQVGCFLLLLSVILLLLLNLGCILLSNVALLSLIKTKNIKNSAVDFTKS